MRGKGSGYQTLEGAFVLGKNFSDVSLQLLCSVCCLLGLYESEKECWNGLAPLAQLQLLPCHWSPERGEHRIQLGPGLTVWCSP